MKSATALFVAAAAGLANGVRAYSEDYCPGAVCEYDFHYQKVMSMTWHEDPDGGYPQTSDTRIWEFPNGTFYALENDGVDDPDRREVPIDEADLKSHRCNVLDGRHRVLPSINGQVPAPTIEVDADTRVIVHVQNEDYAGQSITIHWHGMFQVGTPYYDGIGGISQCHILPGTSFTYDFTANPWGTFWYHAHTGVERTDGVYGALIVHERNDPHEHLYDEDRFFTFVNEWFQHDSLDALLLSTIGVYDDKGERFSGGITPGGLVQTSSALPFEGGLFNDRGQHFTGTDRVGDRRFYQYDVAPLRRYRMRFIAASYLYTFRISIDNHLMTLISADGFDIAPVPGLESIHIYSGERLDVIVTTDQPIGNYWVRAETLEEDPALRHVIKAVMHYDGAPDPHVLPPATQRQVCTEQNPCRQSPCMWNDNPAYLHWQCIPTTMWRNVDTYPDRRQLLPNGSFRDFYNVYPGKAPPRSDRVIFQNWGVPFEVDGITYRMNSHPFLFNGRTIDDGKRCPTDRFGDPECPEGESCTCTHTRTLQRGSVVDFVWYSLTSSPPFGDYGSIGVIHPIHMHGHAFYILAEGLPTYNATTDSYTTPANLQCNDDDCNEARWVPGFEPQLNLVDPPRRDMYALPPGGWVYVRMVADNPGNWAVHCHLETHTATMLYSLFVPHSGSPRDPLNFDATRPENFPTCGNFR